MQAIVTQFAPDEQHRPTIVATCMGKQVRVPYEAALGLDDNHVAAALRLANQLGWRFEWHFGRLATGDYCHVPVQPGRAYSTVPAESLTSPAEQWRGRGGGSLPAPRRTQHRVAA
jgi:hypothetical protein